MWYLNYSEPFSAIVAKLEPLGISGWLLLSIRGYSTPLLTFVAMKHCMILFLFTGTNLPDTGEYVWHTKKIWSNITITVMNDECCRAFQLLCHFHIFSSVSPTFFVKSKLRLMQSVQWWRWSVCDNARYLFWRFYKLLCLMSLVAMQNLLMQFLYL